MTPEIKVKVESKEVSAALARLIANVPGGADATPAMKAIARALKTGTKLRFKTQRDPSGTPWKKTRRGGQILRLTGRLVDSISSDATKDTATVGTNVIYGAIHQFGGVIRAKNAKFLALPIGPAAVKNASNGGGPRHHPAVLAYARNSKGQQLLVDKASGGAEYLLKRAVLMPARPFLGLSDDDAEEVIDVVDRYIDRLAKP